MKKVLLFISVSILLIPKVSARTISDMYQELYYLQEEKNTLKAYPSLEKKELITKEQELTNKVEKINEKIDNLNQELKETEKRISTYQKEIESILKSYQLSNKKNVYLEYIIQANTYKDYIYRTMVTTQIANYNQEMIQKYQEEKKQIEEEKKTLEEEKQKQEKTREEYQELSLLLKKNNITSTDSITTSLEEDISALKEEIKTYQNLGCNNQDEISNCLKIGTTTTLKYPLKTGCVSQEYNLSSHKGMDLSCNKEGTNVYASGRGVVGEILKRTSCGGNIIFIYHNLNGEKYTTIYGHLLEINVSPGQVVDENTIIGKLGGESTAAINGGYDKCTNGAHLHYAISEDYHTYDFGIYTKNPRLFQKYPPLLNGFFTR